MPEVTLGSEEWGKSMSEIRRLGSLAAAILVILVIAGCSHAVFPGSNGTGTGSGNGPVILTMHDTPSSGVTVTSFEVTVTGAVLEPGDVSLVSTPETVELTQLQTNSVFLGTTQVPQGAYTSLTVTYSNPQFTIINNSGAAVATPGGQCAANASCVISNPTVAQSAITLSSSSTPAFPSLNISSANQTLIEFDVNLNNIVQSDLSLNFADSGAVTVAQANNPSGTLTTIDTFGVAGEVSSVDSSANQFTLTASNGQTYTITTTSGTDFEFARQGCMANNFTCIQTGEIVDTFIDLQSDGMTMDAGEVDYDDAANTQQVSGTIVGQNGTPPSSLVIVVHNTIPAASDLPTGTAVIVTIGGSASYVINNGSFNLSGLAVSFASNSDLLIGQEVEARVESGTSITNNTFTTDRLALEQTQLEANVSSVSSSTQPYPYFILNPLPALYSAAAVNPSLQFEVFDTSSNQPAGTVYQDLTPDNISGLAVGQPVTTGGFLFNTTGTIGSPSLIAVIVRGEVPGT
jgi:hypothetical protein